MDNYRNDDGFFVGDHVSLYLMKGTQYGYIEKFKNEMVLVKLPNNGNTRMYACVPSNMLTRTAEYAAT